MNDYLKKMQEFSEIYRQKIIPIFRIYEPLRAKLYRKQKLSNFGLMSSLVLWLVVPFVLLLKSDVIFTFYLLFLVTLFILSVLFTSKINLEIKNFKSVLKEQCLDKVLNIFGNIKRVYNPQVDFNELEQSKIFRMSGSMTYDDCYEGEYNGVPFSIIECLTACENGRSNENGKKVLFITKSNKKVGATTVFRTKNVFKTDIVFLVICLFFFFLYTISAIDEGTKHGMFTGVLDFIFALVFIIPAALIIAPAIKSLRNKINLEDTKVQKDFFFESSDQVEARYLMTPAFIERFKALAKTFKAKEIECSFYARDKFMVKMDAKNDVFEFCQINKSLLNIECMQIFFNEMKVIYDVIDYLKLDEKTGL